MNEQKLFSVVEMAIKAWPTLAESVREIGEVNQFSVEVTGNMVRIEMRGKEGGIPISTVRQVPMGGLLLAANPKVSDPEPDTEPTKGKKDE